MSEGSASSPIDAQYRPIRRADVVSHEVEGEVVVYVPDTEELHALSRTATLVWWCCDGSGTVGEIVADIAQTFGSPHTEVEAGVVAVLGDLARRHMLVGTEVSDVGAPDERDEGEPRTWLVEPPSP